MASTPSSITNFPFQIDNQDNCLQRCTTVDQTLLSAIKVYLVTRPGSRLGSMTGCFLLDLLYNLVGISDFTSLSEKLKSDLIDQFPGVNFYNVNMSLDLSNKNVNLKVQITFGTQYTTIKNFEIFLASNTPTANVTVSQ